jgi:periplasmic protein TonB
LSYSRSTIASIAVVFMIASFQLASATPIRICDSKTFENCHEVEGTGIVPPKLRHQVDTKYPNEARRQRIEGFSVVKLVVDENGMPQSVRVTSSITERLPATQHQAGLEMDENAVKAVKKFRFKSATLNGQAVPSEITVTENYHAY